MKKILFATILTGLLVSCGGSDDAPTPPITTNPTNPTPPTPDDDSKFLDQDSVDEPTAIELDKEYKGFIYNKEANDKDYYLISIDGGKILEFNVDATNEKSTLDPHITIYKQAYDNSGKFIENRFLERDNGNKYTKERERKAVVIYKNNSNKAEKILIEVTSFEIHQHPKQIDKKSNKTTNSYTLTVKEFKK